MRLDEVTVAIRPRGRLESIDLGFALARANWQPVWKAWAVFVLPLMLLVNLFGYWYPGWVWFMLFWLKPFYDRIVLWVLSRAVFGAEISAHELRRGLPQLLWHSELFRDLSYRRINLQRSFNLPVSQLERQSGATRRSRLRLLYKGVLNAAQGLTLACVHFEFVLYWALFGLGVMIVPPEVELELSDLFMMGGAPWWFEMLGNLFYTFTITVVEPFYVAGGFALYLNRRTWLEGWDLELAFRRMAERPSVPIVMPAPPRAA